MTVESNTRKFSIRLVGRLLQFGMVGAWAGLLLGFLGRWHWALDLCSHFYVQFTAIVFVGTIAWLGSASKRFLVLAITAWLMLLPSIAWLYVGTSKQRGSGGPTVRVVSCNVLTSNSNKSAVLRFLVESKAEIALLMEVNQEWSRAIRALDQDFPHQLHQPREDNFGIVLLSKRPWRSVEEIHLDDAGIPSLEAMFDIEGMQLRFIGTHPLPPIGSEYSTQRNLHFANLAKHVNENGTLPTIVIGDLNCTSWSSHFRTLLRASQLRDSREGFGVQRSWPTSMKLSILGAMRIPIDHALVSRDLNVVERRVGPYIGSDHYPIVVDIRF